MLYKRLILIILCVLLLFIAGNFDMREPDDLAFVAALGIDEKEGGGYNFTFQFVNPLNIGAGGEMSGSENALRIMEADGSSFFEAVNTVHNLLSKRLTFGQLKLVLFSEKTARGGMLHFLNDFAHASDFNLNAFCAVSEGAARDYLMQIEPPLESNPIKHYDMIFRHGYSGRIESETLCDVYFKMSSNEAGIITYIIPENTEEKNEKSIGGAAFSSLCYSGDKPVAVLSEHENRLSYMLLAKLWASYFDYANSTVTFIQRRPVKCTVNTTADVPEISITIPLTAKFLKSGEDINKKISETEIALAKDVENFLIKTSREYGCDFTNLGGYSRRNFKTLKEFSRYNWKEKYKNARFKVTVCLSPESSGALY